MEDSYGSFEGVEVGRTELANHAALWLPKGNPSRSHIAGGPFRVTGARSELASLFYLEWVLESMTNSRW